MARFISIKHKTLAVTVGSMVLIGILSISFWHSLLSEQSDYFQHAQRQRAIQQVELFRQLRHEYLTVAFESYSDIRRGKRPDLNYLAEQLYIEFDKLEYNFNIMGLWLFNEQQSPMFSSSLTVPDIVYPTLHETLRSEHPVNRIHCVDGGCYQLSSIPILAERQRTSAIIIQSDMTEMIGWLKRSLKADIGLIQLPAAADEATLPLRKMELLSITERGFVESLWLELDDSITVADTLNSDANLTLNDYSYSISLIPLHGEASNSFILIISDQTGVVQRAKQERQKLLISAMVLFLFLVVITYWSTNNTSNRLLRIADRLPLLSERRFDEFRERGQTITRNMVDELDILSDSAEQLGAELETLGKQVEQRTKELENIAMYDLLTGLPNRNMLHYQLRKSLLNLHRSGELLAVMFLDLDDFKKVNDSHGHKVGDQLLQQAAQRINRSLRESDLVCRFGGDEFVIVLSYIEREENASIVADKIIHAFKQPIIIDTIRFYISPSIGIAFSTDSQMTTDDIIRQADIAMYEAKQLGGGSYKIYDAAMYHRISEKVLLEADVRQALSKGQFSLALQPQIDVEGYKLNGFEALLRWVHPERGPVPPDQFIPILESSEHMIELGYWVIRRSCELLEMLEEQGYGRMKIAINLSATQFLDPGLTATLVSQMAVRGLKHQQIELELTESTLVEDIDQTLLVMNQLRDEGFTCAIDDYGTGYSSLSYLKKMPVDFIKVDKSFISGMLENQADMEIVESTIAMVHRMGMAVVAEGVETIQQLEHLCSLDCDIIQGYLFSPPIPEVKLVQQLDLNLQDGCWPLPESAKPANSNYKIS